MIGSLLCAQLRRLLLLCLIFVVQVARADLAVEITEPRQFGYVLGDKIDRVFVVESDKNVQLNKENIDDKKRYVVSHKVECLSRVNQ